MIGELFDKDIKRKLWEIAMKGTVDDVFYNIFNYSLSIVKDLLQKREVGQE